MLVDHAAATVLERLMLVRPLWGPVTEANYSSFYRLYMILRGIGRMAFPIYCFLLIEGFLHTRSRGKYALRLFIFALVSEVPFDMAFRLRFFDTSYNNVFFTLLIGLLAITALDWGKSRIRTAEESGWKHLAVSAGRLLFIVVIVFAACLTADFLNTDYGAGGVIAICILYEFKEQRLMGFACAVFDLALLSSTLEFAALLMLIPLRFYNGTRGRQSKYFFYAFYPVHLLVLSLACYAMGLGI